MKTPKKTANANTDTVVENTVTSPFDIVSEFVSDDKKRKAVVKRNRETSLFEIEFYKDKVLVASASHAYHTRRFHEEIAESYVKE